MLAGRKTGGVNGLNLFSSNGPKHKGCALLALPPSPFFERKVADPTAQASGRISVRKVSGIRVGGENGGEV